MVKSIKGSVAKVISRLIAKWRKNPITHMDIYRTNQKARAYIGRALTEAKIQVLQIKLKTRVLIRKI